jgi:hypothetical protein
MKHLRQFFITIILMCALTSVALADDGVMHPWSPITTPVVTPEDTSEQPVAVDPATEITLALMRSLIGLL